MLWIKSKGNSNILLLGYQIQKCSVVHNAISKWENVDRLKGKCKNELYFLVGVVFLCEVYSLIFLFD